MEGAVQTQNLFVHLERTPLRVMHPETPLSVPPPECLSVVIPPHYIFECISLPSSFPSFSDIQHQKLHCFVLGFTNSNQIIVKQNYLISQTVNCFCDCRGYEHWRTGEECSPLVTIKIKPVAVNEFFWWICSRLWSLCNFWLGAFKCSVLKNISNKNQIVHQSLYSTQWRGT